MTKRTRKTRNKPAPVKQMAEISFEPVDIASYSPDFGKHHFDCLHIGLMILTRSKEQLTDMWARMEDEDLIGAIKDLQNTQEWLKMSAELLYKAELRIVCACAASTTREDRAPTVSVN